MTIWPYPNWKLKLPYQQTISDLKQNFNLLEKENQSLNKSIKFDSTIVIPDLHFKMKLSSKLDSIVVNVKLLDSGSLVSNKNYFISKNLNFNTWGKENPARAKRNKQGLIQFDEIVFTTTNEEF